MLAYSLGRYFTYPVDSGFSCSGSINLLTMATNDLPKMPGALPTSEKPEVRFPANGEGWGVFEGHKKGKALDFMGNLASVLGITYSS